jgi:hypothetical protein
MATCPIRNSPEWKQVMRESQGNVKLAMEKWVQRGYNNRESLNEQVTNEENLTDKEKEMLMDEQGERLSKKTPLEQLAQKTKVHIKKRIELLSKVKVKDSQKKREQLQTLSDNIKALDEVESISEFINEAYDISNTLVLNMEGILNDLAENPKRPDLVQRLAIINDEVNGYNILDEIADNQDVVDLFEKEQAKETDEEALEEGEEKDLSTKEKLVKAMSNRMNLKRRINVEAIPLIADWLLSARSSYGAKSVRKDLDELQAKINRLNEGRESGAISEANYQRSLAKLNRDIENLTTVAITRDDMIKTLREASRAEGVLDSLIGPLISSQDSVLALFAKAIKDKLEQARLLDITTKEDIAKSFIEYNDVVAASRDNPKKFNEGIYEVVKVGRKKDSGGYIRDKEGNILYDEELHFVSKYDKAKIQDAQNQWYNNNPQPYEKELQEGVVLNKKQEAERTVWRAKRDAFYNNIYRLKSKSEVNKLKIAMEKQLKANVVTQDEYDEYVSNLDRIYEKLELSDRLKKGEFEIANELREPAPEFVSQKWKSMYNSQGEPINAMGKYHQKLFSTYKTAQLKVPEGQRNDTKVPSVPKRDLERLQTEGVVNLAKTNLREAVNKQSYDTEFGEQELSEEGMKLLPVFYTNKIGINDVTFDLASSVLMFSQMANKYEALNQVRSEISLTKSLMEERKVPEFNSQGVRIKDTFANKFGLTQFLKSNGESQSKKHFDAFLDMIVTGEMQKAESIGNLSGSKITNTVTGISALTSIAADLLKGVANNLQGNIQLIIEAKGAEYFSAKNLRKGKANYFKNVPAILGDFGKPTPTSFMGRLTELYEPLQGDFTDNYGRLITTGVANRLIRTDTLFFNQYFGEHELQVSTMLALMDATIVRDKTTKEEITLFNAHEKYGVREAFENIEFIEENEDGTKDYRDFTEKDRRSFQDRLHALNKKMHGVYNNFDKAASSRYSLGRLGMMYRKHMYPGYMRRFQKYRFDEELGDGKEGFYRTFNKTLIRDLRNYKLGVAKQWSTYTPKEKAAIRRVLTEIGIILSLFATIIALKSMADDDEELKESYVYNFILYEAVRMRSETAQYISPGDAWRTVKSPSAALSTASRAVRFSNQILPWNITEGYKRKQGVWEKGDNKAWAYFVKLIGLPGYNINPREAVKIYESLTNI